MTIKTYKAGTNISINVVLASKKNLHVAFVPKSDGSSVYSTDNEEVQNAIERHYNFGKLFRLAGISVVASKKKKHKTVVPAPPEDEDENLKKGEVKDEATHSDEAATEAEEEDAREDETGDDDDDETEEAELRKVKVSDFGEAKDYLADKFGVSRTSLRSQKSILETAKANGIEFEGL